MTFWQLLFIVIFFSYQVGTLKLDIKSLTKETSDIKTDVRLLNARFMSKYEEEHNETKDN